PPPAPSHNPFAPPPPLVASVTEEERITNIVEKVLCRVLPNHSVQPVSAAVTSRPNRDQRQRYYCGRTGHIQRFCRTRQNDRRQESSWRPSTYGSSRRFATNHNDSFNQQASSYGRLNERFRSPSPGPSNAFSRSRIRNRSLTPANRGRSPARAENT